MNAKTFSMILLGIALFAVQEARAANPRSHHLHGIVQSVDVSSHSLTVQKSTKAQPLVIQWNERTRFRDGKEPAGPESLRAGQTVRVSYRVLPGRLEASRVDVRRASDVREKGFRQGRGQRFDEALKAMKERLLTLREILGPWRNKRCSEFANMSFATTTNKD